MNTMEQGPIAERSPISTGVDYYKPTMAQVQLERFPNEQVTFTLKNRGDNLLSDYVAPEALAGRLALFQSGWDQQEADVLATHMRRDGTPLFSEYFLDYIVENDLPPVEIGTDVESGELTVETTGDWPLVTFWETVVMSEINEEYFTNYIEAKGIDLQELYDEGDRRLSSKIDVLHGRPDIKFAEFGTRRRFSKNWQDHVVGRLAGECPSNIIGTSNVALADTYGLMPIGTFAHEMPMVYAAMAEEDGNSPLDGHGDMLRDWEDMYGENLSTALTDTFGSEFFFADFTPEQARAWKSLRHDSGNPFEFGEQVIDFYDKNGIDPAEKTIVFSDGLDMQTIVQLADYFNDRVSVIFGWGTTLTNDLGIKPNNIVMKATAVNSIGTVKLSDNIGKHTGEQKDIDRYIEEKHKKLLGFQALTEELR